MPHTAITLVQHLGYAGLGLGLIISTLGLFSSEVFLLLAGLALRQGSLGWAGVVATVLAAQLIGATASHAIGQYGGAPLIERYGRYVLLSKRDLARAHRWFQRYGRAATPLAYSLPLVRGYAGYAAGLAEQSRPTFMAGALTGSIVWSAVMIGLGYYLGGQITAIDRILRPISYLLAAAIALAAAWFLRHRLQEGRA